MLEHYSRDKIILRVLNTLSFIGIFAFVSYTLFRHDDYNIYKILFNILFFLSPYKYMYVIGIVSVIMQGIFIVVQLDSSSHGIKKRVIENYGWLLFLGNIFTLGWMYFFSNKSFGISLIFAVFTAIFYNLLYIKSQILKKYMYNDEQNVFVKPFSIITMTANMFLLTNLNIYLNTFVKTSESIIVIISLIEITIIVLITCLILYFFKDKIITFLNLIYLVMILIQRIFDNDFMPLGYICFLAIVVIVVFMYKILRKKRKKKVEY